MKSPEDNFSFYAAWYWFSLFLASTFMAVYNTAQWDECVKENKGKIIIEEYIQQHNSTVGKIYAAYLAKSFYDAGNEFSLDPLLLVAVGHPESGFDRLAVSNKGALGVMQIMPFWIGHIPFIKSKEDLLNPEKNIRAGAYILKMYIQECGGLKNGIRCYHGGPRSLIHPKQASLEYVGDVLTKYRQIDSI